MPIPLNNILEVVGSGWVPPATSAKSICSFDLFFLTQLAKHVGAKKITELGCGATTAELCKKGYEVTAFSMDISPAAKKENIEVDFVKCNVLNKEFLPQIIESVKESQLLVIDCLHTAEMARYYSQNILPHANCLVWIHDYWHVKDGYTPYGEQRFLDRNVVGKSHDIWAFTDMPMKHVKEISEQIGHDITKQKHPRPLRKNVGPRMCSVVLEKK